MRTVVLPARTRLSATPSFCSSSSERAWTTNARELSGRTGSLSMMRKRTPLCSSCAASINPVGPAPAIRTSVSNIADMVCDVLRSSFIVRYWRDNRRHHKKEDVMATYISLIQYTQQGLAAIKESPKRLDAARKAFEQV